MQFKAWFRSRPVWVRGGIYGLMLCLFLLGFYAFIYFPFLDRAYGGMWPNTFLLLPTITGHIFPIFSHFIVPYGWMCERTHPNCQLWSASPSPGSVPWEYLGHPGYCQRVDLVPEPSCGDLSEHVGFYGLLLMLFIIYFIAGALIALAREKWKKRT